MKDTSVKLKIEIIVEQEKTLTVGEGSKNNKLIIKIIKNVWLKLQLSRNLYRRIKS